MQLYTFKSGDLAFRVRLRALFMLACVCFAVLGLIGCKSPAQHREKADDAAYDFIRQGQQKALGQTEDFTIERPSDLLRRRLLIDQNLPYTNGE